MKSAADPSHLMAPPLQPQGEATAAERAFARVSPDGVPRTVSRAVAVETPIAIEFNGIGYAVTMATPADLEDFAFGYARAERLATESAHIVDVDHHDVGQGSVLRVTLRGDRVPLIHDRVRHRVSESGCGLCGIENLAQALRPLPRIETRSEADDRAIFAAIRALRAHQPLNAATGGVHAAALCSRDGAVLIAREDVGRHNAFDKLIGAMLRNGLAWDGGFALLSSRCSYELVEKAALAGCPMLVTVSAATDLALRHAAEANLPVVMLARSDALLRVPSEDRI